MILSHEGKSPQIDASAYVAPSATVCGDVRLGPGVRVLFGAVVSAEGAPVVIGANSIVMENAVLRSMPGHALTIGASCLVGPLAHVVGCSVEDEVFVATGAAVFHGARLGKGSEVRIHAVVHIRTELPPGAVVPIGWVAVASQILPAEQHEAIWAAQAPLDFPGFVYGVDRTGAAPMQEITRRRSAALAAHAHDVLLED